LIPRERERKKGTYVNDLPAILFVLRSGRKRSPSLYAFFLPSQIDIESLPGSCFSTFFAALQFTLDEHSFLSLSLSLSYSAKLLEREREKQKETGG
jgi:hypothetical protein